VKVSLPISPHVLVIASVCLLVGAGCVAEPDNPIHVDNARVRALIPGQDKTAGYFDITNDSPNVVRLVGAESGIARAIEFHTSTLDGGVMRMRRLTDVTVAPGTTTHFQPGGNHLMLFGVRSMTDENEIRLLTEDGGVLSVTFLQVPIGAQ